MRKIIIASHHQLAYGMKKTLDFVTGYSHVYDLSAYVDDTSIHDQIAAVMAQVTAEDEVLIFTDILGGSVTQYFFPYCSERVHVICGMNLPLIIAAALTPPELAFNKEDIYSLIEQAKTAIVYVNDHISEVDSDDE